MLNGYSRLYPSATKVYTFLHYLQTNIFGRYGLSGLHGMKLHLQAANNYQFFLILKKYAENNQKKRFTHTGKIPVKEIPPVIGEVVPYNGIIISRGNYF